MRARAGRAASAPGATARLSRRIDIATLFNIARASRRLVNETLPARTTEGVSLAEARAPAQVRDSVTEMSARLTILIDALVLAAAPAFAQILQATFFASHRTALI